MFADFFLMRKILSEILLSSVLIHLELIPSCKLIMSEQKKRAIKQPAINFLQAPVVQIKAEALSVTLSRTRNGKLVAAVVVTNWSAAQ